jgi:tetratricopeptide (TPR) repeat protein
LAHAHAYLAYSLDAAGRHQEAEAAFDRHVKVLEDALAAFPDHPGLKWQLVGGLCTAPVPRQRPAAGACRLAEEAARLSPEPQTLAMAYYRAGRWQECIRELQPQAQAPGGDNVTAWLLLAMAHWHNGDREQARQMYDRAAACMDKKKPIPYLERRLRAEAAELLGAQKQK